MNSFQHLRQEIDNIDSKLLLLFHERSSIVKQVKGIKSAMHSKDAFKLYIKPNREYSIIQTILTGNHRESYSKEFLYTTWRGIISASNFLEQNLCIYATCMQTQIDAFQHFGQQKVPVIKQDIPEIFRCLQNDKCHILAFKSNEAQVLELLKINANIKVFAITRSIESEHLTLLCGKISLEDFAQPAVFLTSKNGKKVFNEEAEIYTDEKINQHTIGAFYPLPL